MIRFSNYNENFIIFSHIKVEIIVVTHKYEDHNAHKNKNSFQLTPERFFVVDALESAVIMIRCSIM